MQSVAKLTRSGVATPAHLRYPSSDRTVEAILCWPADMMFRPKNIARESHEACLRSSVAPWLSEARRRGVRARRNDEREHSQTMV